MVTSLNLQQLMDLVKKIKNYTYNERHCLGEGSFGRVYEGKSDNGLKVAIKKVEQRVISQDPYLKAALETEINIMKKLSHPNIVRLEDVVLTANSIYLIMEYCAGGDLKRFRRNRKLTEQEATRIIKQITSGFQQISKHGIIHRDLKPANILVHEGVFKICDFGFARYFDEAKMAKTCVGTPIYMSPQVLSQKQYTDKTDVWSLGVLYFQLLFDKLPFTGSSEDQLYRNIIQNPKSPLSVASSSSKFIQGFLKGTLQVEQSSRWNWGNVFQAFQLVQIVQKKNSTENLFYRKQSSNESPVEIREKKDPARQDTTRKDQRNNFYRNDASEEREDSMGRSNKRPEPFKPKPRNLLALQLMNDEVIKVEEENIRFLYFILVEFIVSQVESPSYKAFVSSLYQYVVGSYEKRIEREKEKSEYVRVLMSQLQQLRQLSSEIQKTKEGDPRKLAQLALNELDKGGRPAVRGWIERYLQKKYYYGPLQ